jgi:hypothetical protein
VGLPAGLFFFLAAASVPPALDALGRWGRAGSGRPRPPAGRPPRRVLALVPARAEGDRMLPLCRDLSREAAAAGIRVDRLVVLDGGDAAAEAALAAEDVPYLVKRPAGPSKGKALAVATDRILATEPELLTAADCVMVFDADMRLEEGFFGKLLLPEGTESFQLPVRPAGIPAPGPARVEAFSLAAATRVEDLARDAEGLPVRLRGKAMGFSPRAWRDGPAAAHRTTAEDSEATLRLLGRGVRIRALPAPVAFDEASGDPGAMARSRSRWLGGHLKLLAVGAPDLFRIALDSPRAAFVLAADLWLRPRAFVLAGLVLVAAVSDAALVGLALRRLSGPLLPALLASVVSKAAVVFEALAGFAARDALGSPPEVPDVALSDLAAYLRMWLRAAVGALRAPGAWHRARPEA